MSVNGNRSDAMHVRINESRRVVTHSLSCDLAPEQSDRSKDGTIPTARC
jgi:hypothetical protein